MRTFSFANAMHEFRPVFKRNAFIKYSSSCKPPAFSFIRLNLPQIVKHNFIIIIIITLFQEGDIYITIDNHDGPQNNRNNITMQKITLKI